MSAMEGLYGGVIPVHTSGDVSQALRWKVSSVASLACWLCARWYAGHQGTQPLGCPPGTYGPVWWMQEHTTKLSLEGRIYCPSY